MKEKIIQAIEKRTSALEAERCAENKRKWYEFVGDGEDGAALVGALTGVALALIGAWLVSNY